jgi:N-dimethylarginine dimethylaminohydrolase
MAKPLLMCEPTGYDVNYVINPYMASQIVDGAKALRQWRSVKDALIDAGASVTVVEGDARYPDMVFAANAAHVVSTRHLLVKSQALTSEVSTTTAIIAKFRSEHRAGEQKLWADRLSKIYNIESLVSLSSIGYDGHGNPYFEGQGDVVTLPGTNYLIGYGQRTSIDGLRIAQLWLTVLGAKSVVAVELVSQHFYHLDTCLFAGSKGSLYIPEAFSDPQHVAEQVRRRSPAGSLVTEVTADEGKSLCCNAVEVSPGVVVSGIMPPRIRNLMTHVMGYKLIEVDTSEFLKAGGSVRCMTLDL